MSAPAKPPGKSTPEETVKDMWATRPRRPRSGRKAAGVAAGIARRYDIDPLLPRVVFAITTFYGGAGLLAYVIGWLLLPEEDDEVSPVESLAGKGRSATSSVFTVFLALALIPLFTVFFDANFSGFLGMLVCGGGLYLLHRGRGHLGKIPVQRPTRPSAVYPTAYPNTRYPGSPTATYPGPAAPHPASSEAATPAHPASVSSAEAAAHSGTAGAAAYAEESTGSAGSASPSSSGVFAGPASGATVHPPYATASTARMGVPTTSTEGHVQHPTAAPDVAADFGYRPQQPPSWDPLGAAPFAWDLPDLAPPEPEPAPIVPPRRKSRAGLVTTGVALLAVGGMVVAGPSLGGWLTIPHAIGVVLSILGVGMFLGAFRRGGRGLIGLAAPLAVVGIGMTAAWPDGFESAGVGDLHAAPMSVEMVQPVYQRNVGSVSLILTNLPDTGNVHTTATVDLGDVTVVVPETADVVATCRSGLGDVQCLNESSSGSDPNIEVTDYGPDGPGGLKIFITAETTGPGSVELSRG